MDKTSLKTIEIELERKKFALDYAISNRIVVENVIDFEKIMQAQCYRLSTDILCKPSKYRLKLPSYEFPEDWWQAFKQRWFPCWLLARYPVRRSYVGGGFINLDIAALFPELAPVKDKYKISYWTDEPYTVAHISRNGMADESLTPRECIREPHTEGPCNGYPRIDCPGGL